MLKIINKYLKQSIAFSAAFLLSFSANVFAMDHGSVDEHMDMKDKMTEMHDEATDAVDDAGNKVDKAVEDAEHEKGKYTHDESEESMYSE